MWKQRTLRWWTITSDAVRLWLDCDAFSHAASLAFYGTFRGRSFAVGARVAGLGGAAADGGGDLLLQGRQQVLPRWCTADCESLIKKTMTNWQVNSTRTFSGRSTARCLSTFAPSTVSSATGTAAWRSD